MNTIPFSQLRYFTQTEIQILESMSEERFLDFFKSLDYKDRVNSFYKTAYLLKIDDENITSHDRDRILSIIFSSPFNTYSTKQIVRKVENLTGKKLSELTIASAELLTISEDKNTQSKQKLTNVSQKGNTTMFDQVFNNQMMQSFTKNLFSKVDNLVWDLMSNSVAIINENKELSSFNSEESCVSVSVTSSFSMPLPGFAQGTKLEEVKVGDILVKDEKAVGWIIDLIKDKSGNVVKLKYMKPSGTESVFTPPKIVNQITGSSNTVMISRDLTGLLGGKDNTDSFKSLLMPLMMMGQNKDMSKFIPMMLMNAQSGGDNNMMQMMLMQQMMK